MIRPVVLCHQQAVQPVSSPGGPWCQSIPLAGTISIGGTIFTAASENTSAGAIQIADAQATGLKVIAVPDRCTYMEVGAWGDGSSIGTDPILKFWRQHDSDQPTAAGDKWKPIQNLLGSETLTFDGTEYDGTGAAGASRYGIPESTYQQHLYDVRGAKQIVAQLTTKGTSNNWGLWVRFF